MILIHKAFAANLTYEGKLLVMPLKMKLVIVCRTKLLAAIFHFTSYFDSCLKEIFIKIQLVECIPNVHKCNFSDLD